MHIAQLTRCFSAVAELRVQQNNSCGCTDQLQAIQSEVAKLTPGSPQQTITSDISTEKPKG